MPKLFNFSLREGVQMSTVYVPAAISKWHIYGFTYRLCRDAGSFQAPICCC